MAKGCHHYLLSGQLFPIRDEMCPTCFKPSLFEGGWYELGCKGVELKGTTMGCVDCAQWVVRYLDGRVSTIEGNMDRE